MVFFIFQPVYFDHLSKFYIAEDKPGIEVSWGSAMNKNNKVEYTLSLGPKVYTCGAMQKWPNKEADILYGEGE